MGSSGEVVARLKAAFGKSAKYEQAFLSHNVSEKDLASLTDGRLKDIGIGETMSNTQHAAVFID